MEPDKAEENLHDIFADAGRWEAVLLMFVHCRAVNNFATSADSYSDEADVFLENRINSSDTNRNALVSGQYGCPSAECS